MMFQVKQYSNNKNNNNENNNIWQVLANLETSFLQVSFKFTQIKYTHAYVNKDCVIQL